MSFTINTNTSARIAGHHASQANLAMSNNKTRLSTGRKLQTPGDDAGGLSLSYKLSSRVFRTEAASQNAQIAIFCLQVQGMLASARTENDEWQNIVREYNLFFANLTKLETVNDRIVGTDISDESNLEAKHKILREKSVSMNTQTNRLNYLAPTRIGANQGITF